MKRSNRIKKGGNCSVNPVTNVPNCIPDVNMSQYKCPCSYLPLDGYKHNTYPLSNNPPKLNTLYGGKKSKNKTSRKTKTNKNKTIRKTKTNKKTKTIRKLTKKNNPIRNK